MRICIKIMTHNSKSATKQNIENLKNWVDAEFHADQRYILYFCQNCLVADLYCLEGEEEGEGKRHSQII